MMAAEAVVAVPVAPAVLLDAVTDAIIDSNTITSGNGGDGGDGGTGGLGGNGGYGGNPRAQEGGGERGGHGGGGGHGGEGGQGGSGGGGPSYSIMVGAGIAPVISNNTLISGNGAQGGRWGLNGSHGSNGGAGQTGYSRTRAISGSAAEGGWSYNIYDASTSDGMSPVVNANSFTTGTAGNRGSSGTTRF